MTHPALALIESIADERARLQRDPRRRARLEALQHWQVARLMRTYADYAALPRYRDAISFFVQDLYGPHDFSERDRDLRRVLAPWQRILPERALHAVTAALELEWLSQQLDMAVADALADAAIDVESYARAYRDTDRKTDRERQIALIVDSGVTLDALVRIPWMRQALRVATVPARLAGVMALHTFLTRGYDAFAKMRGAQSLLQAVERRETDIMENLFAGAAKPFDVTHNAPHPTSLAG